MSNDPPHLSVSVLDYSIEQPAPVDEFKHELSHQSSFTAVRHIHMLL